MNEATLHYALAHADDDVRQLALQGCRDAAVDLPLALQQISGRQAARIKVPSWAARDGILYPPHLSMEQCSSETTARYKAQIASPTPPSTPSTPSSPSTPSTHSSPSTHSTPSSPSSPSTPSTPSTPPYRKLVDLTGGFGVDFAFMCEHYDEGIYVERNAELCAIAHHNFQELGLRQASVVNAEAETFLHHLEEHVTTIVVDPARRDTRGARTYGISDCTPNVLPLMDELLSKSDHVLLKLSPMLDWRKAVSDVGPQHVEQVHIVAVDGECKELLLWLSEKGCSEPRLYASDLTTDSLNPKSLTPDPSPKERGVVSFAINNTKATTIYSPLLGRGVGGEAPSFLYEPHAALMKAGLFTELAQRYGVSALAPNSHLFVSDTLVDAFPGRSFHIDAISTMNKQELKEKVLPLKQANISVRNFPMSADALRKKLKLSEGGSTYLFASTLADGRHVIFVCHKA